MLNSTLSTFSYSNCLSPMLSYQSAICSPSLSADADESTPTYSCTSSSQSYPENSNPIKSCLYYQISFLSYFLKLIDPSLK